MVSRSPAADGIERRLWIAVELPQQLSVAFAIAFGGEAVEPSVTAGKQYLRHTAQLAIRRRRPLPVQNIQAGRFVGPENRPRILVHHEETRRLRGRNIVVLDIDAVG